MIRFIKSSKYQEHQVLTLGAPDRSWRMLECCIPHYGYPPKEICINGVLYYKSINKSTEAYLIVCFDLRSEKFSFIEVKVTLQSALLRGALINYSGKLGLFISEDNGYFRSSVSERKYKCSTVGSRRCRKTRMVGSYLLIASFVEESSWKRLLILCWSDSDKRDCVGAELSILPFFLPLLLKYQEGHCRRKIC